MSGVQTANAIDALIESSIRAASLQSAEQAADTIFSMWANIGDILLLNFGLGLSSIGLIVTAKISSTSIYNSNLLKSDIYSMAQGGCDGTVCVQEFIKKIYTNYIKIVTQLNGTDAAGNIFQAIINPASYHNILSNALGNKVANVLSSYNEGPYFEDINSIIDLHKNLARTLFEGTDYELAPTHFNTYTITNPATGATTTLPFPGTAHPYP